MTVTKARTLIVIGMAILLGALSYLAVTVGVRSLAASAAESQAQEAARDGPGSLPAFVYNAEETVATTSGYGPPGPVSMVFAGTEVHTGLSGELEHPWIAISGHTGAYRALDAPHLPAAAEDGAVSVSPDGSAMAWGWAGGVVVYDAVTDQDRELSAALGPRPATGEFSPDGKRLLVWDETLRVIDIASGEVVATLAGVGQSAARHAVWTPDGKALTYVARRRLVTADWRQGTQSAVPAPLAQDATLAWAPTGNRLAAARSDAGVVVVDVFDVSASGRVERVDTLSPDGYALQRLLGFSDSHVSVIALRLDTGALERIYRLAVDGEAMTELAQLPGPGLNWVDSSTLRVATQALANGSDRYEEPRWPWSDRAKLTTSALVVLLLLGLYLTRRRRGVR